MHFRPPDPSVHHVPFRAMGSDCEVVLVAQTLPHAMQLAQPAIEEVQRIEQKFSRYRPDSVVSTINAQAGLSEVACDEETWALLSFAEQLFEQSGGLFDITSGVLRKAWDFSNPVVPSAQVLEPLLALVGWPRVRRAGRTVFLPQVGMELDFGGFGKEYAADRAAQTLKQQGVTGGYVNLAGDMRFVGPKPSGDPWLIGIQDPRERDRVIATLPMANGGIATSGDYERYFEIDGLRYCHVLDPTTGMPVTHWRTVSVTAPAAVLAGCCSTIAMLKQSQGLAFLRDCGFDFLAIDSAGANHTRDVQK